MDEKPNKLKKFAVNPQNRVVVVIGGLVGSVIAFFLLSYIFSALNLFGGSAESVAEIDGAPSIESLPGVGDPSVEYSRLIAEQNEALVEKAQEEGGSSLPTVLRQQYSANTEAFENVEIKRDENKCSRENLLKARKSGVAASELKCYGCSAEDLRLAGYTAADLKAAGFSAQELKDAGFSALELKEAGFTEAELLEAGYSPEDVLDSEFCIEGVLKNGATLKSLLEAGVELEDLKQSGVNAEELLKEGVNTREMIAAGFCVNDIVTSVKNPKRLRQDGVKPEVLYEAGASIQMLLKAGYNIREILGIGVTIPQMLAAGVTPDDLREVGVTKKDVAFAEKSLSQIKGGVCTVSYATSQYNAGVQARVLWPLGCQVSVLREAGYTATELVREGVTPGQLRAGGYDASNLVAAGIDLKALVQACYSIDGLLEAGFTAAQLADAGVPVSSLLRYGFSTTELVASGLGCGQLYKSCIPAADLFSLGCSADELRAAGATAAELLNAGYSASDLRAAGYSVEEMLRAGVTPEELLALGVSAAELMAAGVTEGQLLRAGAAAEDIFGGKSSGGLGCSVENVTTALAEGSTVSDLIKKGCSIESLVAAGVTPEELLAAGISAQDLLRAGVSVSDLLAAGATVEQLIKAGADPRDLYLAGVDVEDMKAFSADQLRNAGYSVPENYQQDDTLLLDASDESDLDKVQRLQNEALEKQDRERRIMELSNAMQAQATALFAEWDNMPKQSVVVNAKKPQDYNGSFSSSQGGRSGNGSAIMGPVVKAGTMMLATSDNAINSDDATPILATIITGPLKGSKIIGEFEVENNKLVLKFDRIDVPTKRTTSDISLFAVDVNTTRNVTVDNHYLLKYGSLFAASFLEGMNSVASNVGTSVTTSGSTVTVKEGSLDKGKILAAGLGKVGQNLVAETKKFQSKPATIRMHSGATFGILVMEDFMLGTY